MTSLAIWIVNFRENSSSEIYCRSDPYCRIILVEYLQCRNSTFFENVSTFSNVFVEKSVTNLTQPNLAYPKHNITLPSDFTWVNSPTKILLQLAISHLTLAPNLEARVYYSPNYKYISHHRYLKLISVSNAFRTKFIKSSQSVNLDLLGI